MRPFIKAVVGTMLAVVTVSPAFADNQMFRPGGGGHGFHGGGQDGGRGFNGGGGGFRGGGQGRGGFGGGYRHHGGYGAAVGAGVAGLAAGALIGGAIANNNGYYGGGYYGDGAYGGYGYGPSYVEQAPVVEQVEPDGGETVAYCQQRYRSYDVASGTYLGFDGLRHPCP